MRTPRFSFPRLVAEHAAVGAERRSRSGNSLATAVLLTLLIAWPTWAGDGPSPTSAPPPHRFFGTVHGIVSDSASGQPIEAAEVRLLREGRPVGAACSTTPLGRYSFDGVEAGAYQLEVRRLDYPPLRRPLLVTNGDLALDVRLASAAVTLTGVNVTARPSGAVMDARTGNQVFQEDGYHGSPAATTSQIVQQALAGAARAPTSEVHIRGQHGEFTYYVDGIPVPPGISGSLSELFSPEIVEHIEFQTGGWDAEFGNRNSAIITVATRVPAGGLRLSGSAYAGSFGTFGQSAMASGNAGRFGIVLSATRQTTAMRREPVMQDPRTHDAINFHNSGDDLYGFGKLQYTMGLRDLLVMDLSGSRTSFQVPYDSTGGIIDDDRQLEHNGFVNLGWRHARGQQARDGEVFVALYHRWSQLGYTPGAGEQPTFVFYPDTVAYNVREDRAAQTSGLKVDALLPTVGPVQVKTGIDASLVTGREHFATSDVHQLPGPSVDADVRGGDVGMYAQASIRTTRWWEFRPGLRYDMHQAPLAGTAVQLSPRLRLNLYPTPRTSAWIYYGRLFIPSPVEDFHVLASAGQSGQIGLPTRPERDHFFEGCVIEQFPSLGTTLKLDAYHKQSSPAVDDNTLPGTALSATVDVSQVRVTGIESVIDVHPSGCLGGYVNVALSHAYAHGPITGGFSPTAYPTGWYDLDHDQRLSIAGSLTYDRRHWFASTTGIYGSGLTNGDPSAGTTGLGLFDFNRAVKVAPNFIVDASLGRALHVAGLSVRPQVNIDNAFDRRYILKGAFTSGPSVGRPRSIIVRVDVAHRAD